MLGVAEYPARTRVSGERHGGRGGVGVSFFSRLRRANFYTFTVIQQSCEYSHFYTFMAKTPNFYKTPTLCSHLRSARHPEGIQIGQNQLGGESDLKKTEGLTLNMNSGLPSRSDSPLARMSRCRGVSRKVVRVHKASTVTST